jgi:hypothetical protein
VDGSRANSDEVDGSKVNSDDVDKRRGDGDDVDGNTPNGDAAVVCGVLAKASAVSARPSALTLFVADHSRIP